MIERRARDLAIDGRTARGIALPYGVAADVRLPTGAITVERFEAGAILYSPGLQVNLNHDAGDVLADLPAGTLRLVDGPDALRFEARLARPVAATGASIEFVALKERRVQHERVIGQAALTGIALLDGPRPAYEGATVEVRQAATLGSDGLAGRWDMGRERIERASGSGRRKTRPQGLVQLPSDFEPGVRDVALYFDRSPLASHSGGTLQLDKAPAGGFTFDVSALPETTGAADLRAWLAAGNRVYPDPTFVGIIEDLREPGTGLSAGGLITVGVIVNPILTAITLATRERWVLPNQSSRPTVPDEQRRLWL